MSDKFINEADTGSLSPLEVSALMSEDLEDLCRLCMASEKSHAGLDMVLISNKYPKSNTLISILFLDVLQINVDDADSSSMPQKACMECLSKLFSYAKFKEQSHIVDAKLRQIVQCKQKISEAQALYGPVFSDLDGSFPSSAAPVYFETVGIETPDICAPDLLPAEDVVNLPEEDSCANVDEGKGPWDDNGVTENPESNYDKTKIFSIKKNTPNSSQKLTACSSEKEGGTADNLNIGEKLTDSTDGKSVTVLADIPMVTCFNNQIQTLIEDEVLCPDIIGEVVVPDSSAADEDSNAIDFVPDVLDAYEVPSTKGPNTCESVSSDSVNKCSSSQLPVPEVLAIVGQTEKRLGFRCPLCKKVFQSQNQFRKHAPLHVKAKGGVCKYCKKWFQKSNALLRHERIHSGEKPFLCILCDRSFSQKEILQRHILTHTDTKPFQCQHCDKSYAQKGGLESHVKHHHKPAPEILLYPCPLCNKAFCHQSGLSRHMLTHSGKQYVCKFCDRNFSDSSALRRHSKNKHGSLP